MLLAALLAADSDYFQVKEALREVNLADGTYYKESVRFTVQVLADDAPLEFYHAVPSGFWGEVGYTAARNLRTGAALETAVVRRDELHADLFYIRVALDALPPGDERLRLQVEYHVPRGARFLTRFASPLTPAQDAPGAARRDRRLQARFAAHVPGVYDVSREETTVRFARGAEVAYSTPFSPVAAGADALRLGPNRYLDGLNYEEITVNYTADRPTLAVAARRSVYAPGLPLAAPGLRAGLARVVEEFSIKNTDPAPAGLREGRAALLALRAQPGRLVRAVALTLPRARNVRVYDRVGRVASARVEQAGGATVVTVEPRHALLGGQRGQFVVEYDAELVEQDGEWLGLLTTAGARLDGVYYYERLETCLYPPAAARGARFYAALPPEADEPARAARALDGAPREGRCLGRGLAGDAYGQRAVGLRYALDRAAAARRVGAAAAAIAAGAALLLGGLS